MSSISPGCARSTASGGDAVLRRLPLRPPSGTGSPSPSRGAGLHFLLKLDTEEPDPVLRDRAAALGVRLGFLSEYAAIPSPRL